MFLFWLFFLFGGLFSTPLLQSVVPSLSALDRREPHDNLSVTYPGKHENRERLSQNFENLSLIFPGKQEIWERLS